MKGLLSIFNFFFKKKVSNKEDEMEFKLPDEGDEIHLVWIPPTTETPIKFEMIGKVFNVDKRCNTFCLQSAGCTYVFSTLKSTEKGLYYYTEISKLVGEHEKSRI